MASKPPYINLVISNNANGNTTLVAAQTGKRVIVHQVFFVCAAAVSVRFDSTTATPLTGAMPYAANGGIALPFSEKGWFETVQGELLNMNLSGGVLVAGALKYSVVN